MREFTHMQKHNKCAGGYHRQTPVLLWGSGRTRSGKEYMSDAFINSAKHEHKSTMWICTLENQPGFTHQHIWICKCFLAQKSLDRLLLHDSSGCRYNRLKGYYRKSKNGGWVWGVVGGWFCPRQLLGRCVSAACIHPSLGTCTCVHRGIQLFQRCLLFTHYQSQGCAGMYISGKKG